MISRLKEAITEAKSGARDYIDFFENSGEVSGENEMLLFLKPEITAAESKFDEIANFIFDRTEIYGLYATSGFVMSGRHIKENNLISEHYGIIDAASRSPLKAFSDAMWDSFEHTFGKKREEVKVFGSVEYLKEHPEQNPDLLSQKWVQHGSEKLGSGVYCQHVSDEKVYLVNGFYPRLLNHFTNPESCIACFVLRGDTPWQRARSEFVGATAPEKAVSGSIRNTLLVKHEEYGLSEISANQNGVHLSAGPVEGVVEIQRFSKKHENLKDLLFGRMLLETFSDSQIESILANSSVETDTGRQSIFDLTEECDSTAAIETIRKVLAGC